MCADSPCCLQGPLIASARWTKPRSTPKRAPFRPDLHWKLCDPFLFHQPIEGSAQTDDDGCATGVRLSIGNCRSQAPTRGLLW